MEKKRPMPKKGPFLVIHDPKRGRKPTGKIVDSPPKAYEYANGDHMAWVDVPKWVKKGAYCTCAGEGDEVFVIDEFRDHCAGLSFADGFDQGWEMIHKLEPVYVTEEQFAGRAVEKTFSRMNRYGLGLSQEDKVNLLYKAIVAIKTHGLDDRKKIARIKIVAMEQAIKILA